MAPVTRPEPTRAVVASAAVSVDQAVRMVEQRFHARVVKTQTQQDNGHTAHYPSNRPELVELTSALHALAHEPAARALYVEDAGAYVDKFKLPGDQRQAALAPGCARHDRSDYPRSRRRTRSRPPR